MVCSGVEMGGTCQRTRPKFSQQKIPLSRVNQCYSIHLTVVSMFWLIRVCILYAIANTHCSLLTGKDSYHDFICHHRLHQKQRTLIENVLPGEMRMFPLIQDDDDITWLYSWLLVSLSMENDLLSISHSCGS